MKKITHIALLLATILSLPGLLLTLKFDSVLAAGAGPVCNIGLSSPSAPADGTTAIQITYRCLYGGYLDDPAYGMTISFSASGDGNTLSPSQGVTDSNGYIYGNIKSTTAGTKTITTTDNLYYPTVNTATVTFVTPPPPPPPTTPATKQPSASTTQKPTEVKPITAEQVSVNGQVLTNIKGKFTATEKEPIKFSGKTIPNGIVTIYVFSEPKKYPIKADSSGNWVAEITGLSTGDHHAEIEVTDPATNTTSPRTKILEFNIISIPTPTKSAAISVNENQPVSSNKKIVGLVAIGILITLSFVLILIKLFKPTLFDKIKISFGKLANKFNKNPPSPPTVPTSI